MTTTNENETSAPIQSVTLVASTGEQQKKASNKQNSAQNRGSNFTPKSELRCGRDWSHSSWLQSLKAAEKKWARENELRQRNKANKPKA
jgi:hypothetical protein